MIVNNVYLTYLWHIKVLDIRRFEIHSFLDELERKSCKVHFGHTLKSLEGYMRVEIRIAAPSRNIIDEIISNHTLSLTYEGVFASDEDEYIALTTIQGIRIPDIQTLRQKDSFRFAKMMESAYEIVTINRRLSAALDGVVYYLVFDLIVPNSDIEAWLNVLSLYPARFELGSTIRKSILYENTANLYVQRFVIRLFSEEAVHDLRAKIEERADCVSCYLGREVEFLQSAAFYWIENEVNHFTELAAHNTNMSSKQE